MAQFKTGHESVSFVKGTYKDIVFDTPFNDVPMVFTTITLTNGFDKDGFSGCASIDSVNITNLTKNGFRLWHERVDNDSNNGYVNWLAYCPF